MKWTVMLICLLFVDVGIWMLNYYRMESKYVKSQINYHEVLGYANEAIGLAEDFAHQRDSVIVYYNNLKN